MELPGDMSPLETLTADQEVETSHPPSFQVQEDLLAKVVRTSPIGIALSTLEAGRILDVNEGLLRMIGYTREEIVGQSAVALGLWVDPARRGEMVETLRERRRIEEFEAAIRTKAGDTRRFIATVEAVELDGLACVLLQIADITAQRQAEAAKQAAEAQFRTLVEQIPAVIYTERLGDTSSYFYVSPQVETLLGYTPAEIQSNPELFAQRVHPDDRELVQREGERTTATGEPFRMEYRLQARDGRWVHLRDEAVLVCDASGEPLHWQGVLFDVTEQRQAEAALRENQERFRALVQNIHDVIVVVDRDGNRRYVSPSIERHLGYAPDALVGGSALELVHPDDVAVLREAIASCVGGAALISPLELRFQHRDGSWRHFETVGTNLLQEPGVNGIVFNSRCITARKSTESAMQESEERFRSAFDYAPIGLAIVSPEGRFRQVNRSLCDLVGYADDELLDKTFQEITHPDDLAEDLQQAARLWSGEIDTYQLEKRYLHKNGQAVWIHLTVSAVRDGDRPAHAIAQIQDISMLRHLDLERATMLASEREYTRQLRELTELRADLTAMVAHELRSPVAAVRMMTSMLATGELTPVTAAETFASMHTQIDQLDRLVSDVAASAAAERDDFSIQLHPVSLSVLLDGASVFARAALRDHAFAMAAAPDVRVWCDPERISQVLHNLLDNAAKHTAPGTPVKLTATVHGKRVSIAVRNQGPTIPPEDLGIIFEKFARGRDATTRKTSGVGLGLYLSRRIAEAHGSELVVESSPDRGTSFTFELRLAS